MILSKVPRARANRLLKHMNDSTALRALGTDHANSILSGVSGAVSGKNSKGTVIGMSRCHFRSFVNVSTYHFASNLATIAAYVNFVSYFLNVFTYL